MLTYTYSDQSSRKRKITEEHESNRKKRAKSDTDSGEYSESNKEKVMRT